MKRLVLYPFLFIAFAVLNPLASNLDQLDPSLALRPMAALLLAAGGALLLFYALVRDWQYAGYLTFLLSAFFLVFGHLNRLAQSVLELRDPRWEAWILLAGWGLLLVVLSLKGIWRRLGGPAGMTPFFNLVFALALVLPVGSVGGALLREPPADLETLLPETGALDLECSNRPDIYYIVLDAYGREDVLDSLYEADTGPFLQRLEEKGFYIASESHTNYVQTVFSIPAALNFSYIEPPESEEDGLEYFSGLVQDNRLMQALKGCGYQTVAFESGFYFTNNPEVDLYLSAASPFNEFESLLLADSPVDIAAQALDLQPAEHSYAAHRQRVLYSFRRLANLSRAPGPKVVFAHILSPHPPFVFNSQGRPTEPDRSYSLSDGDDYEGDAQEYRRGYAEQVQFVNRQLERTIDAILARSARPPVIIIQGDHGPGGRMDWDSPQETCLWERSSILNAYYLPAEGAAQLYPSISPVNSFRVVLNTYFGAGLELLPDETYFTSHRLTGQSIDITTVRDSTQNCSLPAGKQGD